jgi:hypothetical protein
VCGQYHAPAAFTPGKDPVPIVQEAGWAPEPVWLGAEFDPRTYLHNMYAYTVLLHVSAIYLGDLQGATDFLVDVCGVYGNLSQMRGSYP